MLALELEQDRHGVMASSIWDKNVVMASPGDYDYDHLQSYLLASCVF